MFALLGYISVWLGVIASLAMLLIGFSPQKSEKQHRQLKTFSLLQFGFLIFGAASLVFLFISSDFSIKSVYEHSHTAKPLFYKIAGSWGNHEGSILLWAVISAGYIHAFAHNFLHRVPPLFYQRALGFLGGVSLGLNIFVATLSNPFAKMPQPFPLEGQGLNPLLQDVGLAIHPPVLYMGYVGMVIPYGLAMAALFTQMPARKWAVIVKPWVYIALGFLTIGIILGSWWAYRELGWGGWWFWDPVENASVLPWLIGLALAHSVMTLSTRGGLGNWSLTLAILAFGSALLGTFLVRSGSLVSVHAFAADPGRGIAILLYFTFLVGAGLGLIMLKAPDTHPPNYNLFSRDGAMLSHNLFIIAIAFTIFLGTAYPPIIQALNMAPLAVGAPFYHATVVPLMVIALVFMAFGPEIPWKKAKLKPLLKNSLIPLGLALLSALGVGLLTASALGVCAVGLSVFIIMLSQRTARRSAHLQPRSRLPMAISHLGIGIFVLAATLTTVFTIEADRPLTPGQSFTVKDYTLDFKTITESRGQNYISAFGAVEVKKNGTLITTLNPEYRFYPARNTPTSEADIQSNIFRDLRLSMNLVDRQDGDSLLWAMRFHMRPAMLWLWISTLITALGLFLAARLAWQETKKHVPSLTSTPSPPNVTLQSEIEAQT